jgi:hypothetical protein
MSVPEKKTLDSVSALLKFAADGFKYNLQTFPDTISAAAFIFTILFQSPPLGALTGSILALNVTAPMLQKFLSGFIGDSAVVNNEADRRCSGHFPGVSFERILQLSDTKSFSDLDHNGVPSYYSMFLGFLSVYVGSLPIIYSKEISYSPRRKASTTYGIVILVLVVVMCTLFRLMSTCENMVSLTVGILAGGLFGLFCVGFLAYISDRRLTNILSFPLIRNRAADGKPIYVCEKAIKKRTPTCAKPMTQKNMSTLQSLRSMIENGSKRVGIPISPDKLDDFATFYANNVNPNTGQLDGQAQNQALTILGITMEQSRQIFSAGR